MDDFLIQSMVLRFNDGVVVTFSFFTQQLGLFGWKKVHRRNGVIMREAQSEKMCLTIRDSVLDALNSIALENAEYGEGGS